MIYTTFKRSHLVVTNSGSTQEKWEAKNLCKIQKTKCNYKERSLSIAFYKWGFEHNYNPHDAYSILDGYSRYHQISIALEDMYNTTSVTNWGTFTWVIMLFGVKNGLPTYYMVVNITFKDYLEIFMKIFLNDFTMHIDMNIHLIKLILCFNNCRKIGINLNLDKCAFMVF